MRPDSLCKQCRNHTYGASIPLLHPAMKCAECHDERQLELCARLAQNLHQLTEEAGIACPHLYQRYETLLMFVIGKL